jgi:predicted Zn-dependent protease
MFFEDNQTTLATKKTFVHQKETGLEKYLSSNTISPDILKLTLDVMLYSGDLKNAYLIVKRGVQRFPNELYWNEKMAQIALWTNRPIEALDYYLAVYKLNGSKDVRKTIQSLANETQNQDISIAMLEDSIREGEETNTTKLVQAYKNSGRMEDGILFFDGLNKKHSSAIFQGIIIDLLLVDQNYEKAQERYDIFMVQYGNREAFDFEFAKAAFLQKNLPKALMYLRRNEAVISHDNKEYWEFYVDMLWLNRDFDALYAVLIKRWKLGLLREYDREILALLAPNRDKKIAANISLESFMKDLKVYGFFSFAYISKELNDTPSIVEALSKLTPSQQKLLETQSEYWIILADLARGGKDEEKANALYLKALSLNPNSVAVNQAYGWFLLESGKLSLLRTWLDKIDNLPNRSDYAMIAATSYLRLQNSGKSKMYFDMVAHDINTDTQSYLLYSDILMLMGEKEASEKYQFIVWKKYALLVEKDGLKGIDSEGLQAYLRLGVKFEPQKSVLWKFIAHEKLTQAQYQNFLLSISTMDSNDEAVSYIKQSLRKSEPWLEFYLAFSRNDTEQMNETLQEHFDELPIADRVQASYQSGNEPLAEELGFRGLDENPMNNDLAGLMHVKWMENANNFRVQNDYQDRDGLIGKHISLLATHKLSKGWDLELNGRKRWQSSSDADLYKEVPNDEAFSVGVAKKFDSFSVLAALGYHDNIDSFLFGEISGVYTLGRLSITGGYFYHRDADESIYTMLAGYKDSIELESTYQVTSSLQFALGVQQHTYYGSDGMDFGKGGQYSLSAIKRFRSAYPDFGIQGALNYYTYSEDALKKGIILNVIPTDDIQILPKDYVQPSINIFYGLTSREIVTKR